MGIHFNWGGIKLRAITFKDRIIESIEEDKVKYFFLLMCLLAGFIAGMLYIGALPQDKAGEISAFILDFCRTTADVEQPWVEIFKASMLSNLRVVIPLWISGCLVALVPISFIVPGTKGFSMGFTMGFMVIYFGFKGFLLSFVSVLPQVLLLVPIMLFLAVCAMKKEKDFKKYTYTFIVCFGVLTLLSCIDAFITPVFIRSISYMFL